MARAGHTVDSAGSRRARPGSPARGISGFVHINGSARGDQLLAQLTGTASIVLGREGDDTIDVSDGDDLDIADGGAGTDSCLDDSDVVLNC